MSWLYFQTWLWYLIAFVVGVLLAWLFLVRPEQRRPPEAAAEPDRPEPEPAAGGAALFTADASRPEEPTTEQLPRVNPALSTLDTTELPVQQGRDADTRTAEIPVVRPPAAGEPDPGTAPVPAVADPGAVDGTAAEPAAAEEPATEEPAVAETATGPVAVDEPAADEPAEAETAAAERPAVATAAADPDAAEPDTTEPDAAGTDAAEADAAETDAAETDAAEADAAETDAAETDAAASTAEQPGSAEPGEPRVEAQPLAAPVSANGDRPDPAAVPAGPYPGSVLPGPDGAAPGAEYTIKGNADSMLFHTPDSPYYGRTKAEVWFRNREDAEAAGFTSWTRRK